MALLKLKALQPIKALWREYMAFLLPSFSNLLTQHTNQPAIAAQNSRQDEESLPSEDATHESEKLLTFPNTDTETTRQSMKQKPRIKPYLVHGCIVSIYTIIFGFFVWKQRHYSKLNQIIHSPAEDALHYEATIFNAELRIDSPFVGPPSPEVDKAWSDLLYYKNVRVSGDDLRRINKTSIPVPGEEDSYWAALSMMHELHCVKRLRQFIYQEYYFATLTEEEKRLNTLHTDHCLEILRQGVICRGDIALVPMKWEADNVKPVADFSVPHKCANWDSIIEWSKPRWLDILKPNYLKHPTLGYSYPDGKNHGIGVAKDPDYVEPGPLSEHHQRRHKRDYPIIERFP
ncbi:hypothetical protein G7Y89_g14064 [Cudoniella acicularis]|uniref:Uncharacterized protein n=1 Tax=Cudoniella acicularis TaxID=354080 RepID=A0A8H4R6A9_9HELO|nr:hypothetical protein G7Y89_g14064 [Cudoniella acicularis]